MLVLTRHPNKHHAPRSGLQIGRTMLWFTEAEGTAVTVDIERDGFTDTEVLHLQHERELLAGVVIVIFKITPTQLKIGIRTAAENPVRRAETVTSGESDGKRQPA